MSHSVRRATIIGLGKLGTQLATQLSEQGFEVVGIRRRYDENALFSCRQADATDEEALLSVLPDYSDLVFVILTPNGRDQASYQKAYVDSARAIVSALSKRTPPKRLFFISSTSVYPQSASEWVDEDSDAQPSSATAQQLVIAEDIYRHSNLPTTIIRFAGIYGPKRYRLIEQAKQGDIVAKEPILFSNRIREEDCVGLMTHLAKQAVNDSTVESLYIGCDREPVALHDIQMWIRQQLDCEGDLNEHAAPSRLRSSKRCSNQRMLESGYTMIYPTFREGYGDLIQRYLSESN